VSARRQAFDEVLAKLGQWECEGYTNAKRFASAIRVLADEPVADELLRKPPAKFTVKELAQALAEAFEADGWGDVDPYLFKEVVEPIGDSEHAADAEALGRTLQLVVKKLKERGVL
jgi:hypothetical protein